MNKKARSRKKDGPVFSQLTLTLWQLRQGWHLLFMVALGMLVAVILVCAIPLYSRIALSAGLRTVLSDDPTNMYIAIRSPAVQIRSSAETYDQTQTYNDEFQDRLTGLLPRPLNPETVLQTIPALIKGTIQQTMLYGYDIREAMPHLHIVQGHLPDLDPQRHVVEIALPVEVATYLNLGVGSEFTITLQISRIHEGFYQLPLRVVGLIEPQSTADQFWQRSDFEFSMVNASRTSNPVLFYSLTSSDALLDTLDGYVQDQQREHPWSNTDYDGQLVFPTIPGSQVWFYTLDSSHLDIDHLDQWSDELDVLEAHLPISSSPLETLHGYQRQVALVQMPTFILLGLIAGMLLLFVSAVSRLLIENRYETIAVLRSRGASRRQIFSIFIVQHSLLGLVALLFAPLCTPVIVSLLVQWTLSPNDQRALNVLSDYSGSIFLNLLIYALVTVVAAVGAGLLAIQRSTYLDVLSLRRHETGTTYIPFWQRFYLDVFIIMLAISGYAVALYAGNTGTLDAQTQTLVVAPLILITASCVLIAGVLLLIRIFPFLLECLAALAARSRSALPTLALMQLTKISRQILSTTVLLTLTTAFAVFTLFFVSAHTQHVASVATDLVGADFSGQIADQNLQNMSILQAIGMYRDMPGVSSATVGYVATIYLDRTPITLKAIDPYTFARTVSWTELGDQDDMDVTLQRLKQLDGPDGKALAVPAFADSSTWNLLKLAPDQRFSLADSQNNQDLRTDIPFRALERVEHTPPVVHRGAATGSDYTILVDYATFASVYNQLLIDTDHRHLLTPEPNYFWLRSSDDPETLGALRVILHQLNLSLNTQLYDRRAMLDILYHDPLYLNMLGVLSLGTITPLLLAVIGSLIGTALSIRRRQQNFAILRALGTAPRQLIGLLTWEQGPLYLFLLLLGIGGGWLLSALILPGLVLSSLIPNVSGQLSASQSGGTYAQDGTIDATPILHVTLPPEALIALAILIVLCLAALWAVIRIAARTANIEFPTLRER